jgi:crotonobetainyl-CoA:carnitine CoA-transferase CaiB-like acyl-CoA transferase
MGRHLDAVAGGGEGTGGSEGTLPLSGIRVADFSRVLAGPYATMMLADFGADVIKIESPVGDETRAWAPPRDRYGDSTYFASVNRNKRSMVCDLRVDADLAEAHRLAETADVVVENFRPGVLRKFGLDYETLHERNPGAIYCSITGFGDAAGAALPGYDLLVQAVGGLMSITGAPDGEPTKAGVALVDVITGLNAVSGILLALRDRDRTGVGTRVRVDLLSSLLSGLVNQASGALATGVSPPRMGNAHPSIAPYELLHTADREIALAVGNDRQFAALCGVLGLEVEERFATNPQRVAARAALRLVLEDALSTRPAAEWVTALSAAGVPAGPVNGVAEAIAFARTLGLEPTVHIDDAVHIDDLHLNDLHIDGAAASDPREGDFIADPVHLDGVRPRYASLPPRLGAHTGADWHEPPTPTAPAPTAPTPTAPTPTAPTPTAPTPIPPPPRDCILPTRPGQNIEVSPAPCSLAESAPPDDANEGPA